MSGNTAMIELLLQYGADPNAVDEVSVYNVTINTLQLYNIRTNMFIIALCCVIIPYSHFIFFGLRIS